MKSHFSRTANYFRRATFCIVLVCASAHSQLAVTVSPPNVTAQKAVVPLVLKNGLSQKVQSARAVCFLLDDQGQMRGQATQWVIGGVNTNGLAAGATNAYYFVITSDKPFTTTNLTAKVSFTRVILEGGKLADLHKDVQVQDSKSVESNGRMK